ncbi:hypothetical protein DFJ63DRAFT_310925 [Scheffersomyces coipomensis]|uniref:uncharacterized protein n=1 Tax=Scheffersomyces coipomensis TaxID=1788519 RepID=UPI00315DDC33
MYFNCYMFRYLIIWILSITLVYGGRTFTLELTKSAACFQIQHAKSNAAIKIQNLRSESPAIPYCIFELDDMNKYINIPTIFDFLERNFSIERNISIEESDFLFLDEYGRLEIRLQLNESAPHAESDTAHYGFIESDTIISIPRDGYYCIYFPWVGQGASIMPGYFEIDISIVNEGFHILFSWMILCIVIIIYYCSIVKGETFAQYSKFTKLVLYFYLATALRKSILALIETTTPFDSSKTIRQEIISYFINLSSSLINLYIGWIHTITFMGQGSLYRSTMPSFVLLKSTIAVILQLLTNFPKLSFDSSEVTFGGLAFFYGPRIVADECIPMLRNMTYYIFYDEYDYFLSLFLDLTKILFPIIYFILALGYSISTYGSLKRQGKLGMGIMKKFKACCLFFFIGPLLDVINCCNFKLRSDLIKIRNVSELINVFNSVQDLDLYVVYNYFHLLVFWMIWVNVKYEDEFEYEIKEKPLSEI